MEYRKELDNVQQDAILFIKNALHALAFTVLAVAAGTTEAGAVEEIGITVEHDSCRVPSVSNPGVMDIVSFKNATEWDLMSDSIILTILDADGAFGSRITSEIPQATISLNNNYYSYQLQRLGLRSFKLIGHSINTFPNGGNIAMQSPSIGFNLGDGSAMVIPEKMTGLLDVYFNNGRKLTVRLYTDGSVPPVKILAPGRMVLSRGGVVTPLWFCTLNGRHADQNKTASIYLGIGKKYTDMKIPGFIRHR